MTSYIKKKLKVILVSIRKPKHCTKMNYPLSVSSVNATKSTENLRIWSQLLKKPLMENFIFCAVKIVRYESCMTLNQKVNNMRKSHYPWRD